MATRTSFPRRDSKNIEAWLVGGGISSLTAAMHLIKDGKMPAGNIHILDASPGSGGGMKTHGDAMDGYSLPVDDNPHFHGECVERLLSLIPSPKDSSKSVMDTILEREKKEPETQTAQARAIKQGAAGAEVFHYHGFQIGMKHRMALVSLMLANETGMGRKRIEDMFEKSFFDTSFWMLWSTTFALQPWHSATEFKRHLRKYLEEIGSLNGVKTTHRTEYNFFESAVKPMMNYLKDQGVDFRSNIRVTDLQCYPDGDPTTISAIELLKAGEPELITIDPTDIVITTVGSVNSGMVFGTNKSPPPPLPANWQDMMQGDWRLWETMAKKSLKFGDPTNFLPYIQQSTIETFTTTFTGPGFPSTYEKLTHDKPGTGSLLSLTGSAWHLTLCIPHQPVFPDQPPDTTVMIGYGLNPTKPGEYVQRPMAECSGAEILHEVLCHLGITEDSSIEDNAKTIPCGMPLGTAPFLTRGLHDRPAVMPARSTNFACVGQFVEIPADTTLEVEYSVRGAQMAVADLMGLPEKPPKPPRSLLMEVFDLII
ncbi:oleate hydratase [Aspergillus egyptiacus]|nr:oleate hydratase [Aspergillus egyptiacus]